MAIQLLEILLGCACVAGAARCGSEDVFKFTDATVEVGLADAVQGALNHAVAWGDFDGDGRLDLFLGNFADRAGQPRDGASGLFRQVAGGKFVRFDCPPVERRGRTSGAVFADLDNDGDLELYVANNTLPRPGDKEPQRSAQPEPSRLYRNDSGGKFVDISADCGACPPDLYRTRDIGVFDYDNDGLLDLFVTQDPLLERDGVTKGCRLFRNLGGLKFEDVTAKAGLPEDIKAFGIAVADLNGDRRPDFFVCGEDRLYLSQTNNTYREAESLREVLAHRPHDAEDLLSGAVFGDVDRDGDLDLASGPHCDKGSRVHLYLNTGLKDGVPQFREITQEVGIPVIPQKAPHPEIGDFDNDGVPDVYWSAYFAEGSRRWPFICRGLGVKGGLPRFAVPSITEVTTQFVRKNSAPPEGLGMVYYVDGPAVDYDGDGDLDFFAGIWPDEMSHFFRNDTQRGNWLEVRVEGKRMNRMGVGAQVRVFAAGRAGEQSALLGLQEITLNGGYSSGRPAIAHFGLGKVDICDVEVTLPSRPAPIVAKGVKANQLLVVREP